MKFEIIDRELNALFDAGYQLDKTAPIHKDFDGILDGMLPHEAERYISDKIDSFYDQDASSLCRGEDGELYAVEFHYTGKALIWQKVISTFQALKRDYSLTNGQIARAFKIPLRTVEDWSRGASTPAPYLVALLYESAQHRYGYK